MVVQSHELRLRNIWVAIDGWLLLPVLMNIGRFIKGILRGVRCTKSLKVLFLYRRPPSWTTLVLYSRAVFIFNEPALFELVMRSV